MEEGTLELLWLRTAKSRTPFKMVLVSIQNNRSDDYIITADGSDDYIITAHGPDDYIITHTLILFTSFSDLFLSVVTPNLMGCIYQGPYK